MDAVDEELADKLTMTVSAVQKKHRLASPEAAQRMLAEWARAVPIYACTALALRQSVRVSTLCSYSAL
jgi:hypothetical protein